MAEFNERQFYGMRCCASLFCSPAAGRRRCDKRWRRNNAARRPRPPIIHRNAAKHRTARRWSRWRLQPPGQRFTTPSTALRRPLLAYLRGAVSGGVEPDRQCDGHGFGRHEQQRDHADIRPQHCLRHAGVERRIRQLDQRQRPTQFAQCGPTTPAPAAGATASSKTTALGVRPARPAQPQLPMPMWAPTAICTSWPSSRRAACTLRRGMKTEGLFSFQYGRIEFEAQVPEAQGFWPAFWLMGNNIATVNWPACGEMDVMERMNAASLARLERGIDPRHRLYRQQSRHTYDFPSGQTAAAWHTYGMIWSKGSVAYYVDDPTNPYVTYTPSSISGLQRALAVRQRPQLHHSQSGRGRHLAGTSEHHAHRFPHRCWWTTCAFTPTEFFNVRAHRFMSMGPRNASFS